MTRQIQTHILLAKNVAAQSPQPNFRHGAVLVKNGKVINTGHNSPGYCSFANRFKHHSGIGTRHAEIMSILNIPAHLTEGAIVYVVRINKNGDLMLSKPCPMCTAILRFVGVKKAIFSINNNEFGVMRL